ncbi:hypothetical protein DUNSADRAFT_17570 [Dunaliella salina]|uniref:Encoded protein n=1 Tax=Dunaliella salina TaxID=3046 RepID=A0ABQ7G1J4_DUNSA|nr:hypothetical protein DUNSADRAFT_17570 [Dunaliella salina]|eukprot:KAF5828473.1 hypothetical protein DUNSADRAFT_17570 [Dunaliella salina]
MGHTVHPSKSLNTVMGMCKLQERKMLQVSPKDSNLWIFHCPRLHVRRRSFMVLVQHSSMQYTYRPKINFINLPKKLVRMILDDSGALRRCLTNLHLVLQRLACPQQVTTVCPQMYLGQLQWCSAALLVVRHAWCNAWAALLLRLHMHPRSLWFS